MSGSDTAYFDLVEQLWAGRQSFLLVEHDIEINDQALAEAAGCDCWWAVSPYVGPFGPAEPLEESLGFTRFAGELIDAVPGLMARAALTPGGGRIERNWRCLDTRIAGALRAAGHRPHIHTPVVQHHVYLGGCTCGTDHDLPVDTEGRYTPR